MAIRFAIYTAVLYAGLVHNVFCVQEDMVICNGEMRSGHLMGDCSLAINRMRSPDEGLWGSMWRWSPGIWTPYRSQFGLQGVVLAAIQRSTQATPERVAMIGGAICGFSTALLLAAFFVSVVSRVGPVAGDLGVLLTACSPPLLAFAPTVYWVLPVMLAPFVFSWLVYPRAECGGWRFALFLFALGALVCVKAMCGYEYISTIILSPSAAVVHHLAACGRPLRMWLRPLFGVTSVGMLGFATAIGLHVGQLSMLTGESGVAVIRERAESRTAVPSRDGLERVNYPVVVQEPLFVPERIRLPVQCFVNYLCQPFISSPQTWNRARFTLTLGWALAGSTIILGCLWRVRSRFPAAAALVPAMAVGLLGAMSWQALAINHMTYHGHLNLITYCVPFGLVMFTAGGAAVQALVTARERSFVGLLAVGTAATIAGNAVALENRAVERIAGQLTAEERVRAVLRGEEVAVPLGSRGPVVLMAPLPINPPYLPHTAAFCPMYAPSGPANELPTGVTGWLKLPRERSGILPLTVICVRGAELVPIRVGYFRQTAVEQLHGKQIACVAFQVVIPAGTFAPGERPRLFAVSPHANQPVIELTASP